MSVTALSLVTDAFEVLQVFQPGDSIPNADADGGLKTLNQMLGGLALQSLTIPAVARVTTVFVSGTGGPSVPYTIGIGATINTPRPPSQAHVVGASYYLTAGTPVNEITLDILTDAAYQAITTKELPGPSPTYVWYNPTYVVSGFGRIHLWPVPNVTTNTLVLYLQQALAAFADLTTSYELPDGYEGMIVANLARSLAKPYGVPVDADLTNDANETLRIIKRSNLKFVDLPNDFARGWSYDINAGNG